MCNQRLDVSFRKFASEWLHCLLAIRFYALLDCSFRFAIAERRLHFGIMVVFHAQFFAHHGVSAAVFSVAGGTILRPRCAGIGCNTNARSRDNDCGEDKYFSFH